MYVHALEHYAAAAVTAYQSSVLFHQAYEIIATRVYNMRQSSNGRITLTKQHSIL